jgi:hypothetical protein
MKKLLLAAIAAVVALSLPAQARATLHGGTHGSPVGPLLPNASAIGQCGIPSTKPVWIDTASPALEHVFGRAGLTLAVSSGDFPARMRAVGAKTVHIDLYLNRRVGTPTAPAELNVAVERANKLFDYAATQSGCEKPLIALNELFGAHLETPWSATNERYRRNVLAYLRTLAERGARPFLLLSTLPYTEGEAGDWWREAAKYADLVPEVYFNGPLVYRDGVVLGNRRLRVAMRRAVTRLRSIDIPPERIGLMLGFQTGRGAGGREGLEPDEAWYQVVKWQALAARQIAAETGIATIWSWGWPSYGAAALVEEKEGAACVYLWTRDPGLCDAPALAEGLDVDKRAGQIRLPSGRLCALRTRGIDSGHVAAIQRLTGDREVAFTALLTRYSESPYAAVPTRDVLAAERAVIAVNFAESAGAYRAALARAGATLTIARSILADELRRLRLEPRMRARTPSAREVSVFYFSYPDLLARAVRARPAPWWLGGRELGLALEPIAPAQLFAMGLGSRTLRALDGTYEVDVLGDVRALGTIPFPDARGAIAAALRAFERRGAFERWTLARQEGALKSAICRADDLPAPGTIRLSSYVPFLALAG